MSGVFSSASPACGLGHGRRLSPVACNRLVVFCEVEVEERAKFEGVPVTSLEGEVESRSIVRSGCFLRQVRDGGSSIYRAAARWSR
jgi:hypothetical protein